MQVALQKFRESIKSETTMRTYTYNLNLFFRHSKTDFDYLVKLQPKEIEDIVFAYIVHLKDRVRKGTFNPNSLKATLAPIKLFLEQNDILINWKKLNRMLPRRVPLTNQLPYTTEDIKEFLGNTSSKRVKAVIHFLASTGCRIGAIQDVKISDVRPVENGAVVTLYGGDLEEYRSCLTPEAYASFNDYLKYREYKQGGYYDHSYAFMTADGKSSLDYNQCQYILKPVLIKSGLMSSKGTKLIKNDKSPNHAFRKRFETVAVNSGVHTKYIEFMLGHFEKKPIKIISSLLMKNYIILSSP